jgi:hypothetical protein
MFRPCWFIFREKLSVLVTLGCTIQLSENVLLTVHCAGYGGLNCIVQPSVTTTESFSLKMTQQGRNMLQCVIIDEKTLCAFVGV